MVLVAGLAAGLGLAWAAGFFGGTVVETNEAIEEHLQILSTDPFKKGWMVKIKPASKNLDGLMDAAEYEAFVAEKAH